MMSEPSKEEFAKVRRLMESVLTDVVMQGGDLGAVNYADLGITSVQWVVDEFGDINWRVIIEECSPDCGIPAAMYSRIPLEIRPVEISCEW
jgi:hypothetical protein